MNDLVIFSYTNHKGVTEYRRVLPISMWFGCTAWHPEAQWFVKAFCLDRQATRDFTMSGIMSPWMRLADYLEQHAKSIGESDDRRV